MFTFNLGDEVREKISGFAGIVTARAEYRTGQRTYCVSHTGADHNGNYVKDQWFGEERLTVAEET